MTLRIVLVQLKVVALEQRLNCKNKLCMEGLERALIYLVLDKIDKITHLRCLLAFFPPVDPINFVDGKRSTPYCWCSILKEIKFLFSRKACALWTQGLQFFVIHILTRTENAITLSHASPVINN